MPGRRLRMMPGLIGMRRRLRRQRGGDAFTDFFTKTIPSLARGAASKVSELVRSRPVSSLATAGSFLPTPLAPILRPLAGVAGALGLGRRRRRRVRRPRMTRAMMAKLMGGRRRKPRRQMGGQAWTTPIGHVEMPVMQAVRF